jgi:hypothetical protein
MRKLLSVALMSVVISCAPSSVPVGQAAAERAQGQKLESYVGKYPSELFKRSPELKPRLKTLLGVNYTFFMARLQVEMPIENVDGALIVRGCMAHSCGVEEAMLAINLADGKLHCGILSDKYGHKVKIFSEDKAHIPAALQRMGE